MKISLTHNAQEVLKGLKDFPAEMARSIARAMNDENEQTVGHIKNTKLTNARPRFLNLRSGYLRRTVDARAAQVHGTSVTSSIGTNVKYAGVHEFGFRGTVTVPTHSRRFAARYRGSAGGLEHRSVLAMVLRAKGIKNIPAALGRREVRKEGPVLVRSHTMKMSFPARAMFRTGIEERADNYRNAISAAILRAWTGEQGGGA